jgi:hypothetical protein
MVTVMARKTLFTRRPSTLPDGTMKLADGTGSLIIKSAVSMRSGARGMIIIAINRKRKR